MKLDSDTMSAKERFETVIAHKEPDRIPIYLMGIPVYSRVHKELLKYHEKEFEEFTDRDENLILTEIGDFTTRYYFGSEIEMESVGILNDYKRQLVVQTKDGFELDKSGHTPEQRAKDLKKGEVYYTVDYIGCVRGHVLLEEGDPYTWYVDGFLKTKEAVLDWYNTYGWPQDKPVNRANVDAYNSAVKKFSDRIAFVPEIGGMQLYESTWVIMGQSRWGYFCRKDPDFIKMLINSRKETQLNILDELVKYNPVAVFGGDDMGQKGRSMVGPPNFRKFFFEPYKQIFDKIHEMGAIAFNHSCGNIVDLLPDYIEAGLDGWQSLEVQSMIDHAELKKKYGDKLLLVGGIDSSDIMCFGKPEDVRMHVEKQIKAMGKGGGYILGPTHDYLNVSYDNAIAMRDACYEFGRYPLSDL